MLVTFSSGSVPTARVLPADDCTFSVSPTRVDVGAAAESGVVRVETQPGCSWTVTADVGWIRLTEATAGTGSGDIPYSVSELVPSWSVPSRRGRLKVRWNTPTLGQNVLVTQIGAPCNAALLADRGPSSSETFGGGGGGGHLIVWTADGGSGSGPWFVAKAPDWVTFTSPFLGLFSWGDSVTFFTVSPNPDTAPRDGAVVFCDGRTTRVHQAGRSLRAGAYVLADFDDDGVADLAVYRPSTGLWYALRSRSSYSTPDALTAQWGSPRTVPVAGDFDGDGKTELAVFGSVGTAVTVGGNWFIRYSSDEYDYRTATAGESSPVHTPEDMPLAADFSGDGKSDFVVYHPLTGTWDVRYTSIGTPGGGGPLTNMQWGLQGDVPVPADFDGDGRADLAVWRPSTGQWFIRDSSTDYSLSAWRWYQWGLSGDIPLVTDFDGDRRADLAVYRPSNGTWYIKFSSSHYSNANWTSFQWGLPGDMPVAADYDGDGRTDLAVWRPSNGQWFIRDSSNAYSLATWRWYQWGLPGDIPLARR